MLKTQNIKCKVYLEGVQVKFNRIEIREQVGMPAQCTIAVPANDRAIFAYPKTVCHVYYRHTDDKSDDKFYLIFEGQLVGYGIQRNFDRREIQLTFSGLLSNWQSTAVANQNLSIMGYVGQWTLSMGNLTKAQQDQINTSQGIIADCRKLLDDYEKQKTIYLAAEKEILALKKAGDTTSEKYKQLEEVVTKEFNKLVSTSNKGITEFNLTKDAKKTEWAALSSEITKSIEAQFSAMQDDAKKIQTSAESSSAIKIDAKLTDANIFGMSLLNKISSYLIAAEKDSNSVSLEKIIKTVLNNTIGSLSLYYRCVSASFHITERLQVIKSEEVEKLLKDTSAYAFLSGEIGQGDDMNPSSIMQIFMQLLSRVGYVIYEMAAPSWIGSKPTGIFMAPPGEYLSPISCNFVFNDEIQSLSFSRNIDQEPTRAFTTAKPFATSSFNQNAGISTILLANVVPQGNIAVSSSTISIRETKEELYRGINLAYKDDSQLASLYQLTYLKNVVNFDLNINNGNAVMQGGSDKVKEAANAKTADKVINDFDTNPVMKAVRAYQNNITNAEFQLARAAARNMTISTSYSPYRICGLPGAVFDNDLPFIMGTISSLYSVISADGQNSQTINLTGVRFHAKNSKNTTEGDGTSTDYDPTTQKSGDLFKASPDSKGDTLDMQDVIDYIPGWYADFNKNKVHDSYYKYVTGESHPRDLISVGATLDTSTKTLIGALTAIQNYVNTKTGGEKNKAIEQLTHRQLVTEAQYKHALNPVTSVVKDEVQQFGGMFLQSRVNRIKACFEVES